MKISSGGVHTVPSFIKKNLQENPEVIERWNDLTPLSRNEYICWITSATKEETQQKRFHI